MLFYMWSLFQELKSENEFEKKDIAAKYYHVMYLGCIVARLNIE